MENIRAALLRGVKAARELLKASNAMKACGYDNNPFFDNYAKVADGIYYLIGEHTDTFEESVTYTALNAPILTDERRVELLLSVYRQNFGQPVEQKQTAGDFMNEMKKAADSFFDLAESCITRASAPSTPTQPKPNTIEPKQMKSMTKKNGGYQAPKQDWLT